MSRAISSENIIVKPALRKQWKARFVKKNIHKFCEASDIVKLKKYLEKKPHKVNLQDEEGRTALHIACLNGDLEIVKFLMRVNADVDIRDKKGSTALHFACLCKFSNKKLKICNELIKVGNAYVSSENYTGSIPLHYFIQFEYEDSALSYEIFSMMVSKGVKVNSQDKDGNTPLHIAALNGCEQHALMLINARSIDINIQNLVGETSVHYAVRSGNIRILQMLLEMGGNTNIVGPNGNCYEVAQSMSLFHIANLITQYRSTRGEEVLSKDEDQNEVTNNNVALNNEAKTVIRECCICLADEINSIFLPCRHSATCSKCGDVIAKSTSICPICRSPVTEVMGFFIA